MSAIIFSAQGRLVIVEHLLEKPCCKLYSGLILTIADDNCSLTIRSRAFPIFEQRLMGLYVDAQSLALFPLCIGITVATFQADRKMP